MKLDNKDLKILHCLDFNARIPLSKLAGSIHVSKQNLNYKIKKLVENKVICGFKSMIDPHMFGLSAYKLYIRYNNVDKKKEENIINYFNKHKYVIWFASLTGSWDLEVMFIARNPVHFNNIFKKIKEDIGVYFSKYATLPNIVTYMFKRDYLINSTRLQSFIPDYYYGNEPKKAPLDDLDIDILAKLSKNCRMNSSEIGNELNVSYHTVQERIKKLEKIGIIKNHRIFIDFTKIGYKSYKVIIRLNRPSRKIEEEFYSFCHKYNFVVYIIETMGDWDLEIDCEIKTTEQFTDFLREIRNKFPDLIMDYEIIGIIKEHKMDYLPMGKELKKEYEN